MRKIFICPDSHIPYEDRCAFELMLRAAEKFKPDSFVIGGDFADCYSVSDHDKSPDRAGDLEWEAECVKGRLDEIGNRVKPKEKWFVAGNHEDRLERYLMRNAKALWGLVKIPKVFGLDEMNWKYVPYKTHAKIGKLHITHDVGQAGQYAHYQALQAYQGNVVINHTHRLGYAVVGSISNGPHVGAMFGWLGDLDKIDYMHKAKAQRDWAHGFGIGYILPNGNVHLQPIPIINNTVVIEGKVIHGPK